MQSAASGELWVDRYAPKRLEDMVANREAATRILNWLRGWRNRGAGGDGRNALMLCGPPGVGKTTAVRVAAQAAGFEVKELNASDQRNASSLARIADEYGRRPDGRVVKPLCFGSPGGSRGTAAFEAVTAINQVLVLEEADGLDGNADRGGVRCMTTLARNSSVPIIFTANLEATNPDLRPFVSVCGKDGVLKFAPFTNPQLASHLQRVVRIATGRMPDEKLTTYLVESCNGDARKLINAAQFILENNKSTGSAFATLASVARDVDDPSQVASSNIFVRARELFMIKGGKEHGLEIGLANAREDEYLTHSFVFGNYIGRPLTSDRGDKIKSSRRVAAISDTFSQGDAVERELRVNRLYHRVTEDLDLMLRTVVPARMCGFPIGLASGQPRELTELKFPSDVLAGNSRWLAAVRSEKLFHGVAALRTGMNGLDAETCSVLYQRLRLMLASGQDAMAYVNIIEPYGISPELWPRFTALALWSDAAKEKGLPADVEKRFVELCKRNWSKKESEHDSDNETQQPSTTATEEGAPAVTAIPGIAQQLRETSLSGMLVKRKRVEG